MLTINKRLFCAFGGLYGAAGMAAYAAASHLGGYYDAIAPVLLGNACALVALSVANKTNLTIRLAGVLIILGVALFTTDIMVRQLTTERLFAYAAPLGGTINIFGWLFIFFSSFIPSEDALPQ